jgi:hypothetical protein
MRFVRNRSFERELVRARLRAVVETDVKPKVEALAQQAQAPWMQRQGQPLIVVEQDGDEVSLVNTDHAAHLTEWGSKNNPPHAPLRRGVRAAGLRLDEQ